MMPSVISFKPRKKQSGFTLVEIIVVVAIISLLAAVAVPAYISFIQRAKETAIVAYLGKVKKAQETHRLENAADRYSGSFDELETTGFVEGAVGAATRVANEYQLDLSAGVSSGEPFWNILADPLSLNPKARHFYIDQTGILRFAVGAPAGPGSQSMAP